MKKIMKELMSKKKLTPKEKKMLKKLQKGGSWWWPFGSSTTTTTSSTSSNTPADPAAATAKFEQTKEQICTVCKAAFGESGCKCGKMDNLESSSASAETPHEQAQVGGRKSMKRKGKRPRRSGTRKSNLMNTVMPIY
jgi:hypothetical protein